MDAANNSRESTDYGGTYREPTDAEEQVLGKAREREGCERSLGWSKSHILGACEDSRRRQKGENQEDGGRGRNGGGGEGGVHAHLEGPSGFITGGVRGNFQFLP